MGEYEVLNKKLAEFAGFKERGMSYVGIWLWVAPEEVESFDKVAKGQEGKKYAEMPEKANHYNLPAFTKSLDACFKWLVPKLLEASTDVDLANTDKGWAFIVIDSEGEIGGEAETPALALCLAIEKLIDKGEK